MAHISDISESGTNMALFKRTTQHAVDAPGYLCVEAQRGVFVSVAHVISIKQRCYMQRDSLQILL